MNSIEKTERIKYSALWRSGNYMRSACAIPWADYVAGLIPEFSSILDIGCGDGITVKILREKGFDAFGIDITLDGIKTDPVETEPGAIFFRSPIWDMPFAEDAFDYVISTDALEHLPPQMIEQSICEIFRIAKKGVIHCIATFPHVDDTGKDLHLTIRAIDWWQEQFSLYNHNGKCTHIHIISRHDFMQNARNV
jgi:SAM-dependent methyltransferase